MKFRGPVLLGICLALTVTVAVRQVIYLNGIKRYSDLVSGKLVLPEFPRLTPQQVANLGAAHWEKETARSSYMNFAPEKPQGVVRIGIFGDSAIFGEESAFGRDLSSLLQDIFRRQGHPEVEVINFAFPGYGVHQSALLWEYLGKRYHLDQTVIYPFSIHYEWDTTFQNFPGRGLPLHARYITKNDTLRLIPVKGADLQEAARNYFSVLTPWRYIRYDRNSPHFLRLLLPQQRRLRTNPFYYTSQGRQEEALTSYRLIFRKMAEEGANLTVICDQPEICRATAEQGGKIRFIESKVNAWVESQSGLYVAPQYHWSALGNELRAQELYFLLTGRDTGEFKVLELQPAHHFAENRPAAVRTLKAFEEVSVAAEGLTAGHFLLPAPEALPHWNETEMRFKQEGVESLILSPTREGPLFIPFREGLEPENQLYLSFQLEGSERQIAVGRVKAATPIFGVLALECPQGRPAEGLSVGCASGDLPQMTLSGPSLPETVNLTLGARHLPLLFTREMIQEPTPGQIPTRRYVLAPAQPGFASIRAKAGSFILADKSGAAPVSLDFLLKKPDGTELRVPFLKVTTKSAVPLYPRDPSPPLTGF